MKVRNTLARMRAMQDEQRAAPVEGRSWFRIENALPTGVIAEGALRNAAAEIYLYDEIGMWGVPASAFVSALRDVASPRINLHINSPGGEIFDGVAIYNALRNHPSRVVCYIDGLAASAASFIAMAGAEIITEATGTMMIHEAQGFAVGTSADMRELADLLDKLTDTISSVYALRTGTPVEQWKTAMAATTWYNAVEMVEAGLADRIAGVKDLPDEAEGAEDVEQVDVEPPADPDAELENARNWYARSIIGNHQPLPAAPVAMPPVRLAPFVQAVVQNAVDEAWADLVVRGNGTGEPRGVLNGWESFLDDVVVERDPLLDLFLIDGP